MGYNYYLEETNDLLQAWNRCNEIALINKQENIDKAEEYLATFSSVEQMKIKMLLLMVINIGKAETKKRIDSTLMEGGDE